MDFSIASILLLDGVTNGAVYGLLGLATVLVFAVTRVEWTGSPCIQVYGASQNNPYLVGAPIYQCVAPSAPHWAEWVESRSSGQVVGIDPEMGSNTWVRCTLWINDAIAFMDFAEAGDGHQVNCIHVVS